MTKDKIFVKIMVMSDYKLSIIIPVFNEEENILRLCSQLENILVICSKEIIFVNDGSIDSTQTLLEQAHQKNPELKIIKFARNFGHQAAVTAGLVYSSGDCVVVMDGDGQDPPEMIEKFLREWENGYNVVYAVRKTRKENIFKKAAYLFFYRLLAMLSPFPIPLDSGDFCLMDRRVVNALVAFPERNRFVRGIRAWVGLKQIGLPYERPARTAGKPKYNLVKLVKLALDGLFSFSVSPLRVAGSVGLFFSLLSFLGGAFTICQRVFHWTILGQPIAIGFATIVCSILFIGGIQLIFLSILGEYLGRVFEEVKLRPLYFIDKKVGSLNPNPLSQIKEL